MQLHLVLGHVAAHGRIARHTKPLLHQGIHLVVNFPLGVLLGHLVTAMLPVAAHDEVRVLAHLSFREGECLGVGDDLAEFAGHEPAHAHAMQEFGDGITGAVVRPGVVAGQQEAVALAADDKALFPQFGGEPRWNLPLGPLGRQAIGAHKDEWAGRHVVVTHDGQLGAADLAHVTLEFGGCLASVLVGRGGSDDGRNGTAVLDKGETWPRVAGMKPHTEPKRHHRERLPSNPSHQSHIRGMGYGPGTGPHRQFKARPRSGGGPAFHGVAAGPSPSPRGNARAGPTS